jgi:hypothetical protein
MGGIRSARTFGISLGGILFVFLFLNALAYR